VGIFLSSTGLNVVPVLMLSKSADPKAGAGGIGASPSDMSNAGTGGGGIAPKLAKGGGGGIGFSSKNRNADVNTYTFFAQTYSPLNSGCSTRELGAAVGAPRAKIKLQQSVPLLRTAKQNIFL
jgi:hypothetical protein